MWAKSAAPQSLQAGSGQAAGLEIQRSMVSMLEKARKQRVVKVLCDLVQRVRLTACTCLRPLLASRSGRSRSPSGHQGGGQFWESTSRCKVSVMSSRGDDRRRVGEEDSIAAGAQLDDDHTRNVSGCARRAGPGRGKLSPWNAELWRPIGQERRMHHLRRHPLHRPLDQLQCGPDEGLSFEVGVVAVCHPCRIPHRPQ